MSYLWNILASQDGSGWLWFLALATVKATLLLAFAALLCLVFRRFTAATRHLLWASVLCASLVLPFLSFIKVWDVPVLPAQLFLPETFSPQALAQEGDKALDMPMAERPRGLPVSAEESAGVQERAEFQTSTQSTRVPDASQPPLDLQKEQASIQVQLANYLLALWAAGVGLLLLRLLVGLLATHSLARRAVEFKDPALTELFSSLRAEINSKSALRLLRSEHISMPIVCGIWRPAILLPAGAEDWPEERRRMVLLHELTHVARRDCLTQLMAQAACAFYWFNPLIWSAARRLRIEREKACDDYVLSIGTRPSDYAHHLLEIARSMRERSVFAWSQTVSVAMARRSQLEGRLLSILSKEKKRGAMSRMTTFGVPALTCVLLLSLGVLRPTLINARNSHASQASNDEKESASGSLAGSSLSASEQEADATAQASETRAKISDAAQNVDSQDQGLKDTQVNERNEQTIKQVTNPDAEQNIVEVIAQRTASNIQTTEVKPQTSLEAHPSLNTAPGQERSAPQKSADFIEEMAAAGYTNLTVNELVRLKTAGVTLEYVQRLRSLGFDNLSTRDLASLSMSGVTPDYIKAMRAAGYNELTAKELVSFCMQGVTPEYIRALRSAGYTELSPRYLIDFAVHGVTPAFIKEMSAAGYNNLSPRELVTLRVFGITPEFIRKARSRLGELTVNQLVSLKNANILEDDKNRDKE
jgi:beta-lactamase regulating signal transducer with metallopeptidase domain